MTQFRPLQVMTAGSCVISVGGMRQERAAQNQALFRQVNEQVASLATTLNATLPQLNWLCECADLDCSERLELSMDEYQALRQHNARFAVACDPKHVLPDVERVVQRNDRYWVVEKLEHAARVAAELDPRS